VRFHWDGRAGEPEPGAEPARLFTGAGAEGVPPGLLLGDVELPRGGGARVLELALEVDPRDLVHVQVRALGVLP